MRAKVAFLVAAFIQLLGIKHGIRRFALAPVTTDGTLSGSPPRPLLVSQRVEKRRFASPGQGSVQMSQFVDSPWRQQGKSHMKIIKHSNSWCFLFFVLCFKFQSFIKRSSNHWGSHLCFKSIPQSIMNRLSGEFCDSSPTFKGIPATTSSGSLSNCTLPVFFHVSHMAESQNSIGLTIQAMKAPSTVSTLLLQRLPWIPAFSPLFGTSKNPTNIQIPLPRTNGAVKGTCLMTSYSTCWCCHVPCWWIKSDPPIN